jgi:hypothetical protein
MENKKQRGGARPGAGRKPVGQGLQTTYLRLPAAQIQAILAQGGEIATFYREAAKEKLEREKDLPSE